MAKISLKSFILLGMMTLFAGCQENLTANVSLSSAAKNSTTKIISLLPAEAKAGDTVAVTCQNFPAGKDYTVTVTLTDGSNVETTFTVLNSKSASFSLPVSATSRLAKIDVRRAGKSVASYAPEILTTPTSDPAPGNFPTAQAISLKADSGAKVYYTLDGTAPTSSSALYTSPIFVSVSQTITAIAIKDTYRDSGVAQLTFNITGTVQAPQFSAAADSTGTGMDVTITSATPGATTYYTTDGSDPTSASSVYSAPVNIASTSTITAIATKSGWSSSYITSAAYTINGVTSAPTFSPAGGSYGPAQWITLTSTTSGAQIYYTIDNSAPTLGSTLYSAPFLVSSNQTIKARAFKTTYIDSIVSTAAYTVANGITATPVFSPAAGAYASSRRVTITSASPGASIYYTTNGTPPSASSTPYSSEITVSANQTINAIAIKNGFADSIITTAAYLFETAMAAPTGVMTAVTNGGPDARITDGANGIYLSWTAPTAAPSGIASYIVTWYADEVCATTGTDITGVSGASYHFTAAKFAKSYSFKIKAVSGLGIVSAASSCSGSVTITTGTWTTDGPVLASAISGNTLFIGGSFTNAGPVTGGGVNLSATAGTIDCGTNQKVNGTVSIAINHPSGGWIIGGTFDRVGSSARTNLAKLNADCSVDTSFNGNVDGSVLSAAIGGSNLYIGGSFESAGGLKSPYMAVLNATTGVAVTPWAQRPNGAVNALAVGADGTVYAGGAFTATGTFSGGSAVFDQSTGASLCTSTLDTVRGTISTVQSDGSGGWYIGGTFTQVGGALRSNIARINADCTVNGWNPISQSTVSAIQVSGSTIYVGGYFSAIGGRTRAGLAALDATTGQATSWNPTMTSGWATTLALSGNTLYVGGSFTTIAGVARGNGASFDITTGAITSWNPSANNYINSMVVSGSIVYAGGGFGSIGGQIRGNIAALDATTAAASAWNPTANSNIQKLAVKLAENGSVEVVYAAGSFTSIGGQSRNYVAALDPTTGLATAFNPNANAACYAVAVSGSTVYVSGSFTTIGGQNRNYLASLNASDGLATPWNPNPSTSISASDFSISGGKIFFGGAANTLGTFTARNRIAAFDPATGLPTAWDPNSNGNVSSMLINGSVIYVGGSLSTIGGQSRNRVAAIDLSTGLATSWNPSPNNIVNAIAVTGSTVYLGGNFSQVGGTARNRLAAVDNNLGTLIAWNPSPNTTVNALAVSGTNVYVGGAFATIGGQSRNRIAAIDTTSGLATSWDPNANNTVTTFALTNGSIYAGGAYSAINMRARNRIAAIDLGNGAATSFNPDASGQVNALVVNGGTIYAGGAFTIIGGQIRNRLAALNPTTGLATSWDPSMGNTVNTLAVSSGILYAGGLFTSLGYPTQVTRNYLAAVDMTTGSATSWNPTANGEIKTIAISGSNVYVGGLFTAIGATPETRNRIAAIDITSGVPTSWDPNASATVWALAVSGSNVYVGGQFTSIGGQTFANFAAIGASTGTANVSWNTDVNNSNSNGYVYAITTSASSVFIGGAFTRAGGLNRSVLAAFDITTGNALSLNANITGTNANSLLINGTLIYVGGTFTNIGTESRMGAARLDATTGVSQ